MASRTLEPPRTVKKTAPASRSRRAAGVKGGTPTTPVSTQDQEGPRLVDGKKVVNDVPLPSPLPVRDGHKPIVFHGFRVLTLEDKTVVHGCGECPDSTDFTGTLGDIRVHRANAHGMKRGGQRKASSAMADIPGIVPLSLRMMPLGELLEMAAQLEQLGDLFATVTIERDEYKKRALEAEKTVRQWERAFANLGFTKEGNE